MYRVQLNFDLFTLCKSLDKDTFYHIEKQKQV